MGSNYLDGGSHTDLSTGGGDWAWFDNIAGYGVTIELDGDGLMSNAKVNTDTNILKSIEHIKGTGQNDIIHTDSVHNTILSGSGSDTIYASTGGDYIDGGESNDLVDFSTISILDDTQTNYTGIKVDLSDSNAQRVHDFYGEMTLLDIENIQGSSKDDFIKGNANNNTLFGNAGNDVLYGISANNILVGGTGSDTFRGGVGDNIIYGENYVSIGGVGEEADTTSRDLIDFSNSGVPVTLNLSNSQIISYFEESSLTLNAQTSIGYGKNTIYNVEDVLGGSGADVLIGSNTKNIIDGATGDDIIFGFGGTDNILIGGSGDDTIMGLLSGDEIYGGTVTYNSNRDGVDTHTNSGNDWVDYSYITNSKAVNIDLSQDKAEEIGTSTNFDTLNDIENAKGTKNADTLRGNDSFNVVNSLLGYKGNDSFIVSKGSDYIDGGEGFNTMDYSSVDINNGGNRVVVDLGLNKATDNGYHDEDNNVVEDTLLNIQKVIGTSASDTIYGNSYANVFIGGEGNDTLDGREGDDTLYGIANDNKLYGGANNDTIYGGIADDTLDGGSGDDLLDGRARDIDGNLVNTTDGNNTYIGGSGNDTIWGGNGVDTLYYKGSESGITVTLKPEGKDGTIVGEGTDILKTHFEVLEATNNKDIIDLTLARGDNTIYSNGGNDTITASENYDDTIYGGSGDDIFFANGGSNIYYGGDSNSGSGSDTINYINAINSINVDLSKNEASSNGFGKEDELYDILTVIASNQNDILKGKDSVDTLYAQDGDDWIIATSGNDVINGGNHTTFDGTQGTGISIEGGGDWLSFDEISTGLEATMSDSSISFGGYSPSIEQIENLFGSKYTDILSGDSNNNTLHGNQGNDTIYGVSGNNFLIGGSGDDILQSGSGVDKYDGGDYKIETNQGNVYYEGSSNHGNNSLVQGWI